MSNDYNKKAPVEAGANRRSDLNQYGTHSSNWDRQLQDRMDQSGAPRGGRNIEMVKLACDIVWAGLLTENEYSLKIKDGFPEGWQTRVPKMMVPTGTMTSPQEVAEPVAIDGWTCGSIRRADTHTGRGFSGKRLIKEIEQGKFGQIFTYTNAQNSSEVIFYLLLINLSYSNFG